MPLNQKQTGTDKMGSPIYAKKHYKKKNKPSQGRKSASSARKPKPFFAALAIKPK
jgi:hypothetical protein